VLRTTLNSVEIRLGGAISYVPDITYWNASSIYLTYQNATTYWFFEGHDVTFHGGGTITANGQREWRRRRRRLLLLLPALADASLLVWWDIFAQSQNKGVAGGSSTTFARPVPLTVGNSSNVVVEDLSIIDSPFWHK
jgi:galacturan 1,4-alpha-galacturonidase